MTNYIPKHFKASEFLPNGYSDLSVMDNRILEIADLVRELVGLPMTINSSGRQYCGYRPADCPIGAPKSQHKLGKAIDLHCSGMSAEDVRTLIKKAIASGHLENIGGIEEGVSWIHLDCRDKVNGKVLYFHA